MRKAAALLFLAMSAAAFAQPTKHRKGPDGLEGWLVLENLDTVLQQNEGPLPTQLILARNGKVIRKLNGVGNDGPFFWNFIFLPDGKRVAFSNGSLHFNEECTLMEIKTGKHLEDYDCYHDYPSDDAPDWVKQLKNAPELRPQSP
jgi:hypothetical protein